MILPVLVGPMGYAAKKAVPLNLAVSLITVATSREGVSEPCFAC
jgi:hypothetical protein